MVTLFPSAQAYFDHLGQHQADAQRVEQTVRDILDAVRQRGDAALLDFSERFDKVRPAALRVPQSELDQAVAYMDPAMKDVWIQAIENIEIFHRRQREDSQLEFFPDGTVLGWKVTPIDRVGVYIPGGTAVYPSSLLMNAIPAQIAGVPRIVVVSPPGQDGLPHRDILAAAALLGLEEIYAVGGAQAIGALAYGTESVPHVFKITGPGNQWVAEAKRQVSGEVGIDSIAGPSEILILCDQPTQIEFLVRDLLSQAEHDPEARALLITTLPEQARAVQQRLIALIPTLPRREIIEASFQRGSGILVVANLQEGIDLVNDIAPEHLEVITADPFATLNLIRNAGAIFLGEHTPEPVGDYFAGPNHTIPTGGRAKFSSPLGVQDFIKRSSVLRYSPERLARESDAIRRFASREQLEAHAEAVRARGEAKKVIPPTPLPGR
ncbi:MAG: histidinol dehydrogenase [Deltaproteobacteria bacterium]|nr:histidinol dehydrogenase [Deltaproteobacteria bacterium]